MFHRSRTEDQQPEQQKTEQKKPEQQQVPVTDNQPQQAEAEVSQPVVEETKIVTQAKEEKTMNTEKPETNEVEERPVEAPAASAPFQRPPQMQRSVPAGFSAPYSGGQSSQPIYDGGAAEERKLVIGKGITMSGEIEACDTLLVEGTLEAALKGAKVLEIAETGTFYGGVEIEEATVAGRFEGELTVHGRLTIKSGGSITGTISYRELAVEAGATLDGKISPLVNATAGSEQTEAPKRKMAPRNDNTGEERGGELPFSGSAVAAAE